jgi:hypothetical protein
MADKAAREAEQGAQPVQWDGESIRRRIKSRRDIVAGERSAEARVEPGGYGAWRSRARGREQVG